MPTAQCAAVHRLFSVFSGRKAEEKIQKAEQKKKQAEDEKAKKKAEREAKAAAEKAQREDNDDDQDDANGDGGEGGPKKRRRRTGRLDELAESDPTVLKELRSANVTTPFSTHTDLQAFVEHLAAYPSLAACARLKKGPVKKVLQASYHLCVTSFHLCLSFVFFVT